MKLSSVAEASEKLASLQSEMESLAKNVSKNVDRQESLARITELNPILEELEQKFDSVDDTESVSLREDLGIEVSDLDVESTLGNAMGIVDVLFKRIIALYNESTDTQKTEIANHVSAVESVSEITSIKPVSGRGVRLTDDKIVEIRNAFQTAWEQNNYIKLPEFMTTHNLNMQAYSLTSLIKGRTYADIGGPIRGQDYDIGETMNIVRHTIEHDA